MAFFISGEYSPSVPRMTSPSTDMLTLLTAPNEIIYESLEELVIQISQLALCTKKNSFLSSPTTPQPPLQSTPPPVPHTVSVLTQPQATTTTEETSAASSSDPCSNQEILNQLTFLGYEPHSFLSPKQFIANIWNHSPAIIVPFLGTLEQMLQATSHENAVLKLRIFLKDAHNIFLIRCFPDIDEGTPKFSNVDSEQLQKRADIIRHHLKTNRTKIKKLLLLGKGLPFLPPEILECPQIEEITLSANHLCFLPKKLFQLSKLSHLDIGYNTLHELPVEIGNLKELRELYIGHNQISKLPQTIGKLQKLSKFHFQRNGITETPTILSSIKSLTEIINYNDLSAFYTQ
jgi:Leucine-rich repeat (LRR) protein